MPSAAQDEIWQAEYPCVHEFLVCQVYDDGSPRVLSTLGISVFDGRWRVNLNDREQHRSAFFSGETVGEALYALDQALAENKVTWRKNTWEENNKKKK